MSTIVFVLCSIPAYIFWIDKPQDVGRAIAISKTVDSDYVKAMARQDDPRSVTTRVEFLDSVSVNATTDATIIAACLLGVMIGAIHTSGWNLSFPMPVKVSLWRIASVLTLILPLIWASGILEHTIPYSWLENRHRHDEFLQAAPYIVIPAYFVARAILIVASFTSLGRMPADTYETVEWAQYLPHF